MITVGLIKELLFIHKALKTPVEVHLSINVSLEPLRVVINNDCLKLFYRNFNIWTESLEEGVSMFGVESCDNVAKILAILDSGDTLGWREFAFYEDGLDKR